MSTIEPAICPDIYHPAIARDGLLTRLRIPGGILTAAQCEVIAALLETIGLDYAQVTNRANLQLRALDRDLAPELLTKLIDVGLAAGNAAIDGIRSTMMSPLAGIDPNEAIDVRPLVSEWLTYLDLHPELGILSTKFSVGFDGGGKMGIIDRPNDIALLAVKSQTGVEFSLHLSIGERGEPPQPVGVNLSWDECVPMLAAIAQAYRHAIESIASTARRKPRLRNIVSHYGLDEFSAIVSQEYASERQFVFKKIEPLPESSISNGVDLFDAHPQRQAGLYYLGIALPLGRWTIGQISGLGAIAARYGSGTLRLTPWQHPIVPDLPASDLAIVRDLVTELGLNCTANHPTSLLRACAGSSGCQFSATDTQSDALALAEYLAANFNLPRPLNIHFSGCAKSCAQHEPADITLWGIDRQPDRPNGYRLEIAGADASLTPESAEILLPERVPIAIGELLASQAKMSVF